MTKRALNALCVIAWLALFLWGATGVYHRLVHGHEGTHYGSYVPWGLWVAAYIYFIGLSAGSFLLSCLIYVFGIRSLAPIGRLALFTAVITLPMALISIFFDLGHMWRSYEVFLRPNFSSMMAWMIWLYTAYFLLILVECIVEMRPAPAGKPLEAWEQRKRRTMRVLGSIGVPLAVAFHGGVGALFATLGAKPMWHSGLFPILFLTGALVSGGALILAIVAWVDGIDEAQRSGMMRLLGRIVLGLIVFDLLLEWAEFSIPMWYRVGPEFEALKTVLFGPTWWVFWVVHVLLGCVVPIVLLVRYGQSRRAVAAAGVLVTVTFMAVRLNIVVPAQILAPTLKGLANAYRDARLQYWYVPSLREWSVVAFIVTGGIAAWMVGKKILPLVEQPAQS